MVFCAPQLRGLPELPPRFLAAASETDSTTGGRFVYDLGAIVGADAADDYFGAWRVWSPLNCSSTCHAGGGGIEADAVKPSLTILCSGEIPLSKWLFKRGLRPTVHMKVGKMIKEDTSARAISTFFRQQRSYACGPQFPRTFKKPRLPRMWACAKPGASGCRKRKLNRCYQNAKAKRLLWVPPLTPISAAAPRGGKSIHVCRTAYSSVHCALHNVHATSPALAGRTVPWMTLARASVNLACKAAGKNVSLSDFYPGAAASSAAAVTPGAVEDTDADEADADDEGEARR